MGIIRKFKIEGFHLLSNLLILTRSHLQNMNLTEITLMKFLYSIQNQLSFICLFIQESPTNCKMESRKFHSRNFLSSSIRHLNE